LGILRRLWLIAGLCFYGLSSFAQHHVVSLDGEWKFQLDKESVGISTWGKGIPAGRTVSVPHTWNIEDGNERYFDSAWYQKDVQIPSEWNVKQVRLHFEAVYHDAIVYVNGRKAGENIGSGYTPFSFDISGLLKYGESNRIVVFVSNKFSDYALPYLTHLDWNNDGGIIRPVSLIVTGKPSIRYAHVHPEIDFNRHSATATIKVKTWEDIKQANFTFTIAEYKSRNVVFSKSVELKEENGVFVTQVNLENIKLWHFDSPDLYTLQVDIGKKSTITDTYNTRFGFRKVEIKGDRFFLNEEPVRLAGIEYMPGSHPLYGMAEPVEVMSTAVDRMKDLNCVITRFHWQQDTRILDMLDERGILVQEEVPWWQKPDNLTPGMEALAKKQIDVMIEHDFNHPCIFSWGVSNEVFANTDRDNYTRLIQHTRSWGGNTFVTIVSCIIADVFANDVALLGDIPTWNDYVGTWHAKVNEDAPGIIQNIKEKALNGRPLLVTEAGLCEPKNVGGDARRIVDMSYHYNLWAKNDFILGCIYFCLNNYRTHFGESGQGRYQQRVHGLTDQWFNKKPSFEAYKELAAPVYFEWVQLSASGSEAEVLVVAKNSLPSYTLKNYKLVWKTISGETKELVLPELKPGDKYETTIPGLNPKDRPQVQVLRPTGYVVVAY
jgi:beta-glucuronidase